MNLHHQLYFSFLFLVDVAYLDINVDITILKLLKISLH